MGRLHGLLINVLLAGCLKKETQPLELEAAGQGVSPERSRGVESPSHLLPTVGMSPGQRAVSGCQCTQPGHIQPLTQQHPKFSPGLLSIRSSPSLDWYQGEVASTQVQHQHLALNSRESQGMGKAKLPRGSWARLSRLQPCAVSGAPLHHWQSH